jgi:hypothetical protein
MNNFINSLNCFSSKTILYKELTNQWLMLEQSLNLKKMMMDTNLTFNTLNDIIDKTNYTDVISTHFVNLNGYGGCVLFLIHINPLIKLFSFYMENVNLLGEGNYSFVYPFINNPPIPSIDILNPALKEQFIKITTGNLLHMSSFMSQAFMDGMPHMIHAAKVSGQLNNTVSTLNVTNLAVLESHQELLYAWWLDRAADYASIWYTIKSWTGLQIEVAGELGEYCRQRASDVWAERAHMYEVLRSQRYGDVKTVLLGNYNPQGPVTQIMRGLHEVGIGNEVRIKYFPRPESVVFDGYYPKFNLLSYASPSEVPSLGKDADYSNSHVFSMDVD